MVWAALTGSYETLVPVRRWSTNTGVWAIADVSVAPCPFYREVNVRRLVAVAGVALALSVVSVAIAAPPGAVRGAFSLGTLAKWDERAPYIKGTQVWCAWRGSNVIVNVRVHNSSVETLKVWVKPRYWIARGSEHGSGFTAGDEYTIRGGGSRIILLDAGKPKGTPRGAKIGRCAPYAFTIGN